MRFIILLLLFFYLTTVSNCLPAEKYYYASYINESEWIGGLGKKVNANIDIRTQNEITSVCYYLGILC
mgnify:CR=1 FL=1